MFVELHHTSPRLF